MNKRTEVITIEQYDEIIRFMINGCTGHAPNLKVAIVLMLISETGWTLEEILRIRCEDVVYTDYGFNLYRGNESEVWIISEKTSEYLQQYLKEKKVSSGKLFDISPRGVQRHIRYLSDYLGYENIGSMSFRKLYDAKTGMNKIIKTNISATSDSINPLGVPGIYCIRCLSNGKMYIGESEDIGKRWGEHRQDLQDNIHTSKLLQADYNKYGSKNFVWNVLSECRDEKTRRDIESAFIYSLGTIRYGYNTRA